jgi:hypothetical protein
MQQESSALLLEKTKAEYQARIDDLNSRLATVMLRVGDGKVWNLSGLVVTSDQAKTLAPNYVYYDDIHCYLSVPASNSWKFVKTTEYGLWEMQYGATSDSGSHPKLSEETDAKLEVAKTESLCLWKGPGLFKIDTTDDESPVLNVFPYVSIEELDNRDVPNKLEPLAKKIGQILTERLHADVHKIYQMYDDMYLGFQQMVQNLHQMAWNTGVFFQIPEFPSKVPEPSFMTFDEFLRQKSKAFPPSLTSDPAAFWGAEEILAGFQKSEKIPNSSFQILHAEKSNNVFQLSIRYIFPSSDMVPEIYWDQEFICIGTGKTAVFVTTSVPWSLNHRATELPWVASWLAGLKVPCR